MTNKEKFLELVSDEETKTIEKAQARLMNRENQQSAVDLLIEKMSLEDVCKYSNELAEAKLMEVENIKKAYIDGGINALTNLSGVNKK